MIKKTFIEENLTLYRDLLICLLQPPEEYFEANNLELLNWIRRNYRLILNKMNVIMNKPFKIVVDKCDTKRLV